MKFIMLVFLTIVLLSCDKRLTHDNTLDERYDDIVFVKSVKIINQSDGKSTYYKVTLSASIGYVYFYSKKKYEVGDILDKTGENIISKKHINEKQDAYENTKTKH